MVQRCSSAQVTVGGSVTGSFTGPGLVALVGVTHSDTVAQAHRLADKVYRLRIFDADSVRDSDYCLPPGSAEVSAADLGLPVLVISQFTLYGSTAKGRRPTWEAAAPRPVAEPLVAAVADRLRELGAPVGTGEFGAQMKVTLTNDGPMTVIVDV